MTIIIITYYWPSLQRIRICFDDVDVFVCFTMYSGGVVTFWMRKHKESIYVNLIRAHFDLALPKPTIGMNECIQNTILYVLSSHFHLVDSLCFFSRPNFIWGHNSVHFSPLSSCTATLFTSGIWRRLSCHWTAWEFWGRKQKYCKIIIYAGWL